MESFYNSKLGGVVQFVSPLQMIPGWGRSPLKSTAETAIGVGSKVLVVQHAADHAAQPAVTTIFQDASALTGPAEKTIGWAAPKLLKAGKAGGPWVYGTASLADIVAHNQCLAETDPVSAQAMMQVLQ